MHGARITKDQGLVFFAFVRNDVFNFRNGNDRQVPTKQKEQSSEQPKTANKHHDVDLRRVEIMPTGGEVVATKRRDRDHKTLKPHTDVHKDTDDHHGNGVGSEKLEPEQLWNEYVTSDHDPIGPRKITKGSVVKSKSLHRHARVPRDEKLDSIGCADHQAGGHDDLVHIF